MNIILEASEVTEIEYLYRDPDNYKSWGSFRVWGHVELAELKPHMMRNEFFVPADVGVPSLVPSCCYDDGENWHQIGDITFGVGTATLTKDQLLLRLKEGLKERWPD